jgi:hypothetical protein
MSTLMKAHFRTLLAASLLSLSSLCLHAQEAAPAPEKKAIAMAGKHEISFNLRNLSFNEVNNSILGLAYRYHWNAKWNLRVQADVGLSYNQKVAEHVDSLSAFSFGYSPINEYNYAVLVGVERKISLGSGSLIFGAAIGYGVEGNDIVKYIPSGGKFKLEITERMRFARYRLRPSIGYRFMISPSLSASVETQLNVEYEGFDAQVPGSKNISINTYRLNISTIPISALTLNLHF